MPFLLHVHYSQFCYKYENVNLLQTDTREHLNITQIPCLLMNIFSQWLWKLHVTSQSCVGAHKMPTHTPQRHVSATPVCWIVSHSFTTADSFMSKIQPPFQVEDHIYTHMYTHLISLPGNQTRPLHLPGRQASALSLSCPQLLYWTAPTTSVKLSLCCRAPAHRRPVVFANSSLHHSLRKTSEQHRWYFLKI